jgi:hypothetical protein
MPELWNVALIGWLLFLPLRSSAQVPVTSDSFLSNPVSPLFLADVPLTTALSLLGYAVRDRGYVVFGMEILLNKDGQEPHVTVNLLEGDTVQTAIESVLRQSPEYKWTVVSDHLVNIFPIQQTKNDFLEIRLAQFEVKDEYPPNILANPTLFISELLRAIVTENSLPFGGVGYGASYALGEGPHMTFSFKDLTIRDLFNRVTAEMIRSFPKDQPPVGWIYNVRPDPAVRSGRAHSWNSLRSVPIPNWTSAVAARQ